MDFCKTDISDIESSLPKAITKREDLAHFKAAFTKYGKVLPVVEPINVPVTNSDDVDIGETIKKFIAAYAKIRDWGNRSQKNTISRTLSFDNYVDSQSEIEELIEQRQFIVIYGPPGVGKTYTASKIASAKSNSKTFFTQFHGETSYSDFVYGLFPTDVNGNLSYQDKKGILINSIEYAKLNPGISCYLIIDEINRANLSNVLGEAFYLFEPGRDDTSPEIKFSENCSMKL